MPKSDTITMQVDSKLKHQAELLCEEMGLNLSTACTMLLRAIVRTRSIPFRIEVDDPFYSAKNQAYLQESINELEAGRGCEHELINA